LVDLRRDWPAASALGPLAGLLERLLGLDQLNAFYARLHQQPADARDFCLEALRRLGVDWHVDDIGLERLRRVQGPCLVLANHPLGGRDALLMHGVLGSARADYRILANRLLGGIPQVRSKLILVDPFGGAAAVQSNRLAMRETRSYLEQGGLVGIFPAGEVSVWRSDEQRVSDKDWAPQVARLAQATGATLVPLYFTGESSRALQWLARIHPLLKTPFLAREMLYGPARCLEARLGLPMAPAQWAGEEPRALAARLRQETYALAAQPSVL
jgi:putative hemolysin